MRQQTWEKEWNTLNRKESAFLERRSKESPIAFGNKLDKVVPDKLQDTLEIAFRKAFQLIFEKGSPMIEKSFSKEKHRKNFQIRAYTASMRDNRASLKAFRKSSAVSSAKNMAFSGVEGLGFGILGVGLPDIPVFTAMILKSVYEIAINYGFSYESREEQYFLLCLIRASLERGSQLKSLDRQINALMKKNYTVTEEALESQINTTAAALSQELLYLKFIQGIPIVGVVGGLSDIYYLRCITEYANLKYYRCFLYRRKMSELLNRNVIK